MGTSDVFKVLKIARAAGEFLKLFDLRFKKGHFLYQILFKCDLPDEGSPAMDCRCGWLTFQKLEWRSSSLTLKITSAQVVETSVINNSDKSPSQDYLHPQDHS